MSSKLLINESPLQVLPSLVKLVGLERAIILQQVQYLYQNRDTITIDGQEWLKISYSKIAQSCGGIWTARAIGDNIRKLETDGYLISFEVGREEGTAQKFYRVNYEKIEAGNPPTFERNPPTPERTTPTYAGTYVPPPPTYDQT